MIAYLPFPPSVNTYWRRSGRHIHISEKGREYREAVIAALSTFGWGSFGDQRLAVKLELHRGDRRSYDVDNFCKGLFDAFTHAGVWTDDSQIDELLIRRGDVDKTTGGYVKIEVLPA
jgi:crossover junction endodeoxyribonuclease RusA